jgi:hypothetical protein
MEFSVSLTHSLLKNWIFRCILESSLINFLYVLLIRFPPLRYSKRASERERERKGKNGSGLYNWCAHTHTQTVAHEESEREVVVNKQIFLFIKDERGAARDNLRIISTLEEFIMKRHNWFSGALLYGYSLASWGSVGLYDRDRFPPETKVILFIIFEAEIFLHKDDENENQNCNNLTCAVYCLLNDKTSYRDAILRSCRDQSRQMLFWNICLSMVLTHNLHTVNRKYFNANE